MTMMIENTRIPSGSKRLRPTGKRRCIACNRHKTSLLVDHTISVHSKSSAESTSDATSDSDPVVNTANAFPAKRRILAITLILIAKFAFLAAFLLFSFSSSGNNSPILPSTR
ncbi:hypothetical protein FOFC_09096 [Fusarium oxysporum]|nr:hypothetical protein FOFC_09096 [Fusarium oxysporum]